MVTLYSKKLPEPIRILESLLEQAGLTVVRAAFRYSFFVAPESVRERTPYFPDRARMSREHYPKGDRGHTRQWNGQDVHLGDNSRAQMAWAKYTGRPIARGSGYGVRHIWGNPWDPFAFTAGWNLCYMPFWLGMLTEDQHPHEELVRAIQQASFDLYFSNQPVCDQPSYVQNPGVDLSATLGGESIQVLAKDVDTFQGTRRKIAEITLPEDVRGRVLAIRKTTNASWSNLLKAVAALQQVPHEPFGTPNVAKTSKSIVRRMACETQLSLLQLENVLRELGYLGSSNEFAG
jgi:hypothetical protein